MNANSTIDEPATCISSTDDEIENPDVQDARVDINQLAKMSNWKDKRSRLGKKAHRLCQDFQWEHSFKLGTKKGDPTTFFCTRAVAKSLVRALEKGRHKAREEGGDLYFVLFFSETVKLGYRYVKVKCGKTNRPVHVRCKEFHGNDVKEILWTCWFDNEDGHELEQKEKELKRLLGRLGLITMESSTEYMLVPYEYPLKKIVSAIIAEFGMVPRPKEAQEE